MALADAVLRVAAAAAAQVLLADVQERPRVVVRGLVDEAPAQIMEEPHPGRVLGEHGHVPLWGATVCCAVGGAKAERRSAAHAVPRR